MYRNVYTNTGGPDPIIINKNNYNNIQPHTVLQVVLIGKALFGLLLEEINVLSKIPLLGILCEISLQAIKLAVQA